MTNIAQYQDYSADFIADGSDSTYFWSNGALKNLGGKNAYIGVDIGSVITVENIYIATGSNGGDVFTNGVVEISEDGKNWTEIASGGFSDTIYITNLHKNARYVRMRNTDISSTNWVKVREFEINSNRTAADNSGKFKISTSLPTYMDYVLSNTLDKNQNTFFWSSRSTNAGDYVMIDLASVSAVSSVTVNTGVKGHTADCMSKAKLQYSADGTTWVDIDSVASGRKVFDSLNIEARYIRLYATASGTNWFTMSEFTVDYVQNEVDYINTTTDATPAELLLMTDGSAITYMKVNDPGKTVTYDVNSCSTVKVIAPMPGTGTKLQLIDQNGNKLSETDMKNVSELDCSNAASLVIVLGDGDVCISEIVCK